MKKIYIQTSAPYEFAVMLKATSDEEAIETMHGAKERNILKKPNEMETFEIPEKDLKWGKGRHPEMILTTVKIKTMDNARKVV